eukprot:TRINITY_DN12667_c0_g1_i4.p1 TRINITY_DN12667_c0_g1~~TRINITY_DN12667_c0_g1_i4.p1  ORF type:complete len:1002 (-),score=176.59 TRINITY_DN12667_c0_g1_i4:88-3093(-)
MDPPQLPGCQGQGATEKPAASSSEKISLQMPLQPRGDPRPSGAHKDKENHAVGTNNPPPGSPVLAAGGYNKERGAQAAMATTPVRERPGRLEEVAHGRRRNDTAHFGSPASTGSFTTSLGDRIRAEAAKTSLAEPCSMPSTPPRGFAARSLRDAGVEKSLATAGEGDGSEGSDHLRRAHSDISKRLALDAAAGAGALLSNVTTFLQCDSASPASSPRSERVGEDLWSTEQPQLESFKRRFLLMSQSLQRSNESQAELQRLLERTLDQCDRLREAEAESQRECCRLRDSESEMRQRCALLDESEAELQQKCDKLRGSEARAEKVAKEAREAEAEAKRKCEELQAAEVELRRARDHHQHRWCVLDQEREGLQRVAQKAQAAELAAKSAEKAALEEATAWRRWLASFLDILLRRGSSGLDTDRDVSKSQSLQERQPWVHGLLIAIAKDTDKPTAQPSLLGRLPSLFEHVTDLISTGRLAVRWGACLEEERARQKMVALDSAQHLERIASLEKQLNQKELTVAGLEHDRRSLQSELRILQNTVQELKGSIRVFCRLRPAKRGLGGPLAAAGIGCHPEGSQRVALRKPPGDRRHEFLFDRVFSPEASQSSVYEEVEPLLSGVLEGLHLCIFAYGQTGAGKTYTLSGGGASRDPQGIQDLAIGDLMRLAEQRSRDGGDELEMWLSALEIYNETVQDLLVEGAEPGSNLDLRQSRDGLGLADGQLDSPFTASVSASAVPSPFGSMRVPSLRMRRVNSISDVEPLLKVVNDNRHTSSTCLNSRSSRSHSVLSLTFVNRSVASGDAPLTGVLHIVDLAGSERTKVSQAEGQQMKEANAINKSLATLADVLYALGEESSHVPYRNSKLTFLLQDALGSPGCKTLLFAQISPEPNDVHESYSTMTFASRVATNVQKGRLRPGGVGGKPRQATPPRTSSLGDLSSPYPPNRKGSPGGHMRGSPQGKPRGSPTASPRSQTSDNATDFTSPQPSRRRSSSQASGIGGGMPPRYSR